MIQIINTGVANIRSLQAAFDRIGAKWMLTEDADSIASASHVVLPGVGAFGAAVEAIDSLGIRDVVTDRLSHADKPTLCICLGLQLLCESSEESPNCKGLGILKTGVSQFSNDVKVPQLGWNSVIPSQRCRNRLFEPGEAYFANSFRLGEPPDDWDYATTNYDGEFVSCLWRDRILACQFHPELSGKWGQSLLKEWCNNA